MPERPGVLVLMGSGETSPTMVEVHRSVVRRLGRSPRALLLDTPYAFQENAADISARARRYFADSVGVAVQEASGAGALVDADWVFSGPGSPTYALDHWRGTEVGAALRARVGARAGATVLASAAACTAGVVAVPVYEIYKVGAEPHWREGLDLLSALGLSVAVIPHYDNAEGGTHDTRYCYLGERRLSQMERELPEEVAVLGIDEHTAVLIDLLAETVTVRGRGTLTVRRRGAHTVFPAGAVLGLAELRELAKGVTGFLAGGERPATPVAPAGQDESAATLAESVRRCESRFDAATGCGDADALGEAVLELEAEITRWAADTEEDEGGVEQARAVLRHLVTRLGRMADLSSPRERLAPLVDPLVALRGRLREQGAYETADAVRDALAAGGVQIEDTAQGPRWTVT
ncbi:hypothetical protein Sme01_40460 [Sphaerisporangium melleum]|uniref:Cysteinyl-tRNA synthetase n=1 Tax=Sphaerisporangium melleum TaxID=321316 RepID=A0A917VWA0_9ACTN|nr:hypothetical protein [Sphaerisporangium melleum]GGL21613.1 hypothetical protein GCM10007964_74410 [Sphaerisporangium melleum]GII71570.1 hypothetical protein Sme01_40460 [Sphaerisporangium melleum]